MKTIITAVLVLFALHGLKAQEEKFQAMFVYNFTRTLQWPESAQKGDFVIGIYGDSDILKELKTFTQDKKVRGEQKINVQKVTLADAANCHILIITKSKTAELPQFMSQTNGKSVLVVTETSGKTGDGACISFSKDESGIVIFEFGEKNIKKQGIGISTSFRDMGIPK